MGKVLMSVLLSLSMFLICVIPAHAATYNWKIKNESGQTNWICFNGNSKVYGWNYIDGNWYYFYKSSGIMAVNTFIDGYYLNEDGAWTSDIPYEIQRIIDVIPDSAWIYNCGNLDEEPIVIMKNQNFGDLCSLGWNVPSLAGSIVSINYNEFFVADDGTVFTAPHQAYDTIYQYDNLGNVVAKYEYHAIA